jgi:transcriptional regulator MraZ
MKQFWGTHQNKRDGKGRVSIPAPFRAVLRGGNLEDQVVTVVLRSHHKHSCIEAWPVGAFEGLAGPLQAFNVYSDDQEDLATTLYADAIPVDSDKEGRIILPDWLVRHAELDGAVTFVGLGSHFQIWEPAAAERRRAEARERARVRNLTLALQAAPAAAPAAAVPAAPAGGAS